MTMFNISSVLFFKKKEDVKQLTIVLIYFVVSDLLNDQWVGRVRILK